MKRKAILEKIKLIVVKIMKKEMILNLIFSSPKTILFKVSILENKKNMMRKTLNAFKNFQFSKPELFHKETLKLGLKVNFSRKDTSSIQNNKTQKSKRLRLSPKYSAKPKPISLIKNSSM